MKMKIKPSVEIDPSLDALESSPEFQVMLAEMTDEFLAAEDPEFFSLMQAVKNGERDAPKKK